MQSFPPTVPASAPQEAAYAAIANALPPSVVSTLIELFGTDIKQWRFIIDLFCETVAQDLANLETAISTGGDRATLDAAHRIVGSARMLGHAPIGDAAREIERIAQRGLPMPAIEIQRALSNLRAQIDDYCLRVSQCAWPDDTQPT